MTKQKIKRIHTVCAIVLSILAVTVAVCFIVACLDIYHSGSRPFTRESISAHFRLIALPVHLFIAASLTGGIVSLALPLEEPKKKGVRNRLTELRLTEKKLDSLPLSPEDRAADDKRRKTRKLLFILALSLLVIGIAVALLYLGNRSNFPAENINAEVFAGFSISLLSLLPALAVWIVLLLVSKKHLTIARDLVKKGLLSKAASKEAAPSGECSAPLKPSSFGFITRLRAWNEKHEKKLSLTFKCLIVTLAIVFLIAGIQNGGAHDVVQKAIKICTECIGLG